MEFKFTDKELETRTRNLSDYASQRHEDSRKYEEQIHLLVEEKFIWLRERIIEGTSFPVSTLLAYDLQSPENVVTIAMNYIASTYPDLDCDVYAWQYRDVHIRINSI